MSDTYNTYYGFNTDPFGLNPDPKFFFKDKIHTDAMKYLVYGIQEREGVIEVTGEVGTGKTLLCLSLIKHLDAKTKCVLILTPPATEKELYEDILEKLNISTLGKSRKEMLQLITEVANSQYEIGHSLVIVLDEAQHFSINMLEKIRLLYNITAEKRSLQIVLVGQPELEEKLKSKPLRQLDQRVTLRYRKLTAFDKPTAIEYINYRMELAGPYHTVEIAKSGYNEIHKFSGGVPRLINIACDKALLAGFLAKTNRITGNLVKVTLESTQARWSDKEVKAGKRVNLGFYSLASAFMILVAGYLGYEYRRLNFKEKGISKTAFSERAVAGDKDTYSRKPPVPGGPGKQPEFETREEPADSPLETVGERESLNSSEPVLSENEEKPATPLKVAADKVGLQNKKRVNRSKKKFFYTSNAISKPISLEIQAKFGLPADLDDYNLACMAVWLKSMGYRKYQVKQLMSGWKAVEGRFFDYSAVAKRFQLKISYLKTSIQDLEKFKIPCILINYFDPSLNEDTSMVLAGVSSSNVMVYHPIRGMIDLTVEDLNKGWGGKAVAFWKNVDNLPNRLIYPWLENRNIIKKLGTRLEKRGFFQNTSNTDYLINLIEGLKKFQKKHGLKPDGIVGPKTKLLLYGNFKNDMITKLNSL